jgi:hypothetical protein
MKKLLYTSTLLCLLTAAVYSQSPTPGAAGAVAINFVTNDAPKLTRFNLNFPGGNPQQLVAAIEKATGRPLNVVIPDEYANESITALRMNQVTVPDLFKALEQASLVTIPYRTGMYGGGAGIPSYSYQQLRTMLTFQTSGRLSDDCIWYFRGREKAPDPTIWGEKPEPNKMCRFYSLTPYLESGYKVEDITTAVQTGWKLLGDKATPTISFHKETKLLIAAGHPDWLLTIDGVLDALRPSLQLKAPPALRAPAAQKPVVPPEQPAAPVQNEP